MFTVKPSYHSETRKITFSGHPVVVPGYVDLQTQIRRVFGITGQFYLSQVLFSPDAANPDKRILVAKAIHNAQEYNRHIGLINSTKWTNPLMRFDIIDVNTPAGLPIDLFSTNNEQALISNQFTPRLPPHSAPLSLPAGLTIQPANPFVYSHYSPSYLIPSQSKSTVSTESSTSQTCELPRSTVLTPQPKESAAVPEGSCCAVDQGKAEVKALITTFKQDLNEVLTKAFGTVDLWEDSRSSSPPASRLQLCTACNKLHTGPDTTCVDCTRVQDSTPVPPMSPPTTETPTVNRIVHRGILCDACHNVPEGVRHKCLDCADYDLCESCIGAGKAEAHNPFHEFFPIMEPGRVIVHTLRDRTQSETPTPDSSTPAVHNATCNLCESLIRGSRFKCLKCPDFDTCESCFTITNEQHPDHSFVRLSSNKDLHRRAERGAPKHYAMCNECDAHIRGVRYKCMHPTCPDYDLCEECEALPIPIHPTSHPLLKMKTADTVVPTVYRVGGSQLISEARTTTPIKKEDIAPPNKEEEEDVDESTPFIQTPTSPVRRSIEPIQVPSSNESKEQIAPPLPPKPTFPHGYVPLPQAERAYNASPFDVSEPTSPVIPGAFQYNFSRSTSGSGAQTPRADVFESHQSWKADRGMIKDASAASKREDIQWQDMLTGLEHLMEDKRPEPKVERGSTSLMDGFRGATTVAAPPTTSDVHSPLSGNEALLSRPQPLVDGLDNTMARLDGLDNTMARLVELTTKAKELVNSSATSFLTASESNDEEEASTPPILSAAFVEDVTVFDGQVLPPGAEFMKCWRMRNDGEMDWPQDTVMSFVGGKDMLKPEGEKTFFVGSVKKGESLDLWTGELKAPERAGKYVSYWRLKDGQGEVFGDSVWIDISVAEPSSSEESQSPNSGMSSSSVIVMPTTVTAVPTSDRPSMVRFAQSTGSSAFTAREDDDDVASDSDSDMSLLSAPSSLSDEMQWEASREAVPAPSGTSRSGAREADEFVVLYDDRSRSSDED